MSNGNAAAITAFLEGPADLSNKERHVLTTERDMMLVEEAMGHDARHCGWRS